MGIGLRRSGSLYGILRIGGKLLRPSNELYSIKVFHSGQERLKRDFLVPRKPKENTFDETVQEGKKSPKRIRKLILDAAEALVG